jgi:hypothetical protein
MVASHAKKISSFFLSRALFRKFSSNMFEHTTENVVIKLSDEMRTSGVKNRLTRPYKTQNHLNDLLPETAGLITSRGRPFENITVGYCDPTPPGKYMSLF